MSKSTLEKFLKEYNFDWKAPIVPKKKWSEEFPFNTPTHGGVMPLELQYRMLEALNFLPEVKVEVWNEGNSVRFKIRREFNPNLFHFTEVQRLASVEEILRMIRGKINASDKKFKRCKVFYLDYEKEPEMNSFNIVYNPAWKKYENYEILFRSNTQLRRSRGV